MSNRRKLFWEDRLKFGEHFVTNKVVKISEALGGRLPLGWPPFVKCYIEGDSIIELRFRLTSPEGNSCDFLGIMKCTTRFENHWPPDINLTGKSSVWQSNDLPSFEAESRRLMENRADDRTFMFVIVPEAIENPERMRVWVVPSLIWLIGLETLDEVYCSWREAIERFQFGGKLITLLIDRKAQVLQDFLGASRKAAKLPNHVIQYRAEIVDAVTSDKTQSQWRLFPTLHLDPQEFIDPITVFLGHHFMMNTVNKSSGLTLEVPQVLPCPIKTLMKLFKVGGHE